MGQKKTKIWTHMCDSFGEPEHVLSMRRTTYPRPKMSDTWQNLVQTDVLPYLLRRFDTLEDIPEVWIQLFEKAYEIGNAVLIKIVWREWHIFRMAFTQTLPLRQGMTDPNVSLFILLTDSQYSEICERIDDTRRLRKEKENQTKAKIILEVEKRLTKL